MPKVRVYVDTSVFGGVIDPEFAEPSKRFFQRVEQGDFILLLSNETLRELAKAPEAVKEVWKSLPADALEAAPIDEEVKDLAQKYIGAGVLGLASESDALHVAAATVANAGLILSWNFKHIVNFARIQGFNGVNVMNGYRAMAILSPLEVGYGD